jgi:hypothetical protein
MQRMTVMCVVVLAMGIILGTIGNHVVNAGSPTPGRTADERALRETDLAFSNAAAAKALERLLAFYADEGSMLPPNLPMATGQAARPPWPSVPWSGWHALMRPAALRRP